MALTMSPNLRMALHRALDIVLDAMADEAREEKPKKKRTVKAPPPAVPSDVTEAEVADVRARLSRAGYRSRAA